MARLAARGQVDRICDSHREIDAAVMFDPLAAKLEGSGKYRSIGNLADAYKAGTGDDFLSVTRRTTTSCERSRRR